MVGYNTDFDITRIRAGAQMVMKHWFSIYLLTKYFILDIEVWITNKEISFDPNNSVLKKLWCKLQLLELA